MKENHYKGKFIVFEGPEGSGHSTHAELFRINCESRGFKTLLTAEPTKESSVAERIARALRGDDILEGGELQELFVQDRKEHLERVIEPALKEGLIVICDRYIHSTIAYGSLESRTEWLIKLNDEFLLPDLSYIIMVESDTSLRRIARRKNDTHIFQSARTLKKVNETYRALAERFPKTILVDGERSIPDIHREIVEKAARVLQ